MAKQKNGYKMLPLWETIDSFRIQSSSSWYRSMPCRHSDEDKILLRYKFRSPSSKGRKATPFAHDGLIVQSMKGGTYLHVFEHRIGQQFRVKMLKHIKHFSIPLPQTLHCKLFQLPQSNRDERHIKQFLLTLAPFLYFLHQEIDNSLFISILPPLHLGFILQQIIHRREEF